MGRDTFDPRRVYNPREVRAEGIPLGGHLVQGDVRSQRTMRGHPAPVPKGEVSDGSRRGERGGGWQDPNLDD